MPKSVRKPNLTGKTSVCPKIGVAAAERVDLETVKQDLKSSRTLSTVAARRHLIALDFSPIKASRMFRSLRGTACRRPVTLNRTKRHRD